MMIQKQIDDDLRLYGLYDEIKELSHRYKVGQRNENDVDRHENEVQDEDGQLFLRVSLMILEISYRIYQLRNDHRVEKDQNERCEVLRQKVSEHTSTYSTIDPLCHWLHEV